jgi:hypothetical protein
LVVFCAPCGATLKSRKSVTKLSAINGRTIRHAGYGVSQTIRKRIEESFAWAKTIAGLHKSQTPGSRPRHVPVHFRDGGLQSDPDAETAGSGLRRTPADASTT